MKGLSIAVLSDLHCHPNSSSDDCSYLYTDLLRTDSKNHPVESLNNLIHKDGLQVDVTLCPGDFTNKSNVQGLISGWDFALEVNKHLKGKDIIATLGNHDVDSYQTFSNYSLELVKGISKGFPLRCENLRNQFWATGCAFIEENDYRILVINSSHYHYNKDTSGSGKVSKELINYVDEYMEVHGDNKISIALAHHHPITHARLELGIDDIIVNGEELLEALGKHKFDIFIHGHKHDAWLRYHPCSESPHQIPIFSSGSFSAKSNLLYTGKRNHFHIIDIQKQDSVTRTRKNKNLDLFTKKRLGLYS